MKVTRLYTGTDQKSHFEEIELKFGGDQRRIPLRAGGHGLGTSSGATPPIPRHAFRFVGNRGQQRRRQNV